MTSNAGLRALVAALSSPTTVVASLDLGSNCLGTVSAEHLARLVASQPRLRELKIAHNQICGPWGKQCNGMRALAAALAETSTLDVLDISANSIGARDADSMHLWSGLRPTCPAIYLVEAMRQNTSLQSIVLTSNNLVGEQSERMRSAWRARGAPPCGLLL